VPRGWQARQPSLGRGFRDDENRPGAGRVVVLSHRLWTRRFGASRAILGDTVSVNGEPHAIVGVMPRSFRYPEWAEMWLPSESTAGTARGMAFST